MAERLTVSMATPRLDRAFSPADLAAVEAAVHQVETRSPGEIVPYAVERSDGYTEAAWTVATLGALLGALASAAFHAALGGWLEEPALWAAGPPAAGATLGYLVAAVWPMLRVRLTPAHLVAHRVHQRAAAAFLEQEVFRTRSRTGILIFVSLLERRVVVLADAGINARVAQAEWEAIVAEVVLGMRKGEPGPTLAAAIRRSGDLLAAHGLARGADDRDELPDQLQRRRE